MKSILSLALFFVYQSTFCQEQVNLSINRNIEVINAIAIPLNPEMLEDSAKNPWMYDNTQLMRLAQHYFKPYAQHRAVGLAKGLFDKLGTGIYLLALYYEDLPSVRRKFDIPGIIWTEVNRNKDSALGMMDDFMRAAADFCKKSRFENFQRKYAVVYQQSLQQVKRNLPGAGFIPALEQYYGDTKGSYNIVVMPFFKSQWGMGWEIVSNGKSNIFNITAPFDKQTVIAGKILDAGFGNANEIKNLSIHEFGHSFVNTLTSTAAFLSAIKQYDSLFRPIKNFPQYSDWITLFNEHVVRAGEIIVMRQLGETAFAEERRKSYSDWIYLDFFINELTEYSKNKSKYKDFKAFLPDLIRDLEILREK